MTILFLSAAEPELREKVKRILDLLFVKVPISNIGPRYKAVQAYEIFYASNYSKELEMLYDRRVIHASLKDQIKTKRGRSQRFAIDLFEKDLIANTMDENLSCLIIENSMLGNKKMMLAATFLKTNFFVCKETLPSFVSQRELSNLWKEQQDLLNDDTRLDFKIIEKILSGSNATLKKTRKEFQNEGRLTGYANLILKDQYIRDYLLD